MAKPDASGAGPADGKRKSPSGARAADSARVALPQRMESGRSDRCLWQDGAIVEIVTKRLRLRPFQVDDLPAFVAYRSVPDVARYQSWEAPYSPAAAERFLASQGGVEFGT
jgi:RimJ/RimL family protein N-acetyltransferase